LDSQGEGRWNYASPRPQGIVTVRLKTAYGLVVEDPISSGRKGKRSCQAKKKIL